MNPTAELKVRHKPDCPGMLEKDINNCTCDPPLCEFRNCNNCETYQPDYNGIPMADGCQCVIPETGELPKWQPSEPYMVHLVNFVHMVRGVAIGDLGRTQPPPENTAEELYADISGFLSDPWNTDIYEYPLRNAVFEGQRIWLNLRKVFVDQWKQMKQGLNDQDICGKCGSHMNTEIWCNKCHPTPDAPKGHIKDIDQSLLDIPGAEFWKNIVFTDGEIDTQKVFDELHDYGFLLYAIPIVYQEVTGGKMSKTHYIPSVVIDLFRDYVEELNQEAVKEAMEDLDEKVISMEIHGVSMNKDGTIGVEGPEKAPLLCCHPGCNKSGIIQILLDASPDGYTFSCPDHIEDLKEDGKKNEVLYPNITKEIKFGVDGDQVCVLWGPNLQEGISGFGTTLEDALKNFAGDLARNGINTWPWPDWAKKVYPPEVYPMDVFVNMEAKDGPWFHASKGLFFARESNGSVIAVMARDFNDPEAKRLFEIDEGSWGSIIAHCSKSGGGQASHQKAVELHEGES